MKYGWKFLVYEPHSNLVIRNMSSAFLAYEMLKGFSSLPIRPIPNSFDTEVFFTRDINKENYKFNPKTYSITPVEDPPEYFVSMRNLFNYRLKFINKIYLYIEGRSFPLENTHHSMSAKYFDSELEKIYADPTYRSDIIAEYSKELDVDYDVVLQELTVTYHERKLRSVRMHAKFRKYCDAIHETTDYTEMDSILNHFLESWYLDRLQ
jgi:hypothetical protein